MAERFDLDAIEADDALLDLLAAGGDSARAAGEQDAAVRLLADLRLAVEVEDELPVETIDDPETFLARCAALNPVIDPFARKVATRGLAVGVAAVAALSVSGVAAAVTGDPLSPYEKVIEKVVDGLRTNTVIPPKEDLHGMPIVDKTKIVKVAKDFQKKQQLEQQAREARGEDSTVSPILIQEENRLISTPPLLRPPPEDPPGDVVKAEPQRPEVTEPVKPIDDGKPKDGTDKPDDQPTGEPTSKPTEPTGEPTKEPTTAEPTDPATTTTPPPVDPTPTPTPTPTQTQQPNNDPGTETGNGSTGNPTPTPGAGGTQKPDTQPPTTVPSDDGADEEKPGEDGTETGSGDADQEAGEGDADQDPAKGHAAQGAEQGGGKGGAEQDEVRPEPVLPTPTGAPLEIRSEIAQFFKQARHSNGKPVSGSVKATYPKGKHSSGRYAEGRHAAIHRAHGSVASPNVLKILGLLNGPMN